MQVKRVHDLIEPLIRSLGFELWACDLNQQAHSSMLRIYIDRDNGITVDDCSLVSREVGAILDVEDVIKTRYQLEVSSPGMDRSLLTIPHFQRYVGQTIKIKFRGLQAGHRQGLALIEKIDGDRIFLTIEGDNISVTLSDIQKANLVVQK